MRIALITAHNPVQAGQFAQPASLAQALAASGHRVTLYARQQSARSARATILCRGASVKHVSAGPARPLAADQAAKHMPEVAAYLADHWRTRPPDVVHAFSWLGGLAAVGAVRGTGTPVLLTFESLAAAERRHAADSEASAARLRLEDCLGRAVDAVLASSCDEAAELARRGVKKAAIRVVPCGVDTDLFSPVGATAGRGSRFRLVASASAGQPRGLSAVVRALTQLPDTELVIVGGPAAGQLPRSGAWRDVARLASAAGVRSRITFAGELPEPELAALLRSADLMVGGPRYEPAGIAALQAMACGLPVVVPAVGALGDAVVDGVTGLLVAPDNPAMLVHRIRALRARPVQREALGIAAVDRAKSRYALSRIARETAAAYEWCVRGQNTAHGGSAEENLACDADGADERELAVSG
ncbi:MAG: glycosyltransferase [Streptosporangiaceae bacterium]